MPLSQAIWEEAYASYVGKIFNVSAVPQFTHPLHRHAKYSTHGDFRINGANVSKGLTTVPTTLSTCHVFVIISSFSLSTSS